MKPPTPKRKLTKPRKKQRTEAQKLQIAKDFKRWATEEIDDPKSRRLTAEKFFLFKSISRESIAQWSAKYPKFKKEYLLGLRAIGLKREEGMMRKELSEKSTMFRMHMYLPEWKEAQLYHDERERETGSTILSAFKGKLFALNGLGEKSEQSSATAGDKEPTK